MLTRSTCLLHHIEFQLIIVTVLTWQINDLNENNVALYDRPFITMYCVVIFFPTRSFHSKHVGF